jgi:hypothetical protein
MDQMLTAVRQCYIWSMAYDISVNGEILTLMDNLIFTIGRTFRNAEMGFIYLWYTDEHNPTALFKLLLTIKNNIYLHC